MTRCWISYRKFRCIESWTAIYHTILTGNIVTAWKLIRSIKRGLYSRSVMLSHFMEHVLPFFIPWHFFFAFIFGNEMTLWAKQMGRSKSCIHRIDSSFVGMILYHTRYLVRIISVLGCWVAGFSLIFCFLNLFSFFFFGGSRDRVAAAGGARSGF